MSCLSKQPRWWFQTAIGGYQKKSTHKSTRDVWHNFFLMICILKKRYLTYVLFDWVGCCEMRAATHTCLPACHDSEGWLWHAVSLWWRSWNMIMIPNHRTCMIPLWHWEIGYCVGRWHESRRTADQKKRCACCGIFWTTDVRDFNNLCMFFVWHKINILPAYICHFKIVYHI